MRIVRNDVNTIVHVNRRTEILACLETMLRFGIDRALAP